MQNDMQRLGEAAGLAAALAVESGRAPRHIDVQQLQAALVASGGLRPPGAKPRFLEKREEAMGSLKTLPSPDRAGELVEKLDGPDASRALLTLTAVERGSALHEALLKAAQSDKPEIRFRAAAALAMRAEPQAIPALIRTVEERVAARPSPECHLARADVPAWIPAVALLGRLRAREAVPALIAVLDDPAAPFDGVLAAVRTLGRIGDPDAAGAIERLVRRPGIDAVRRLQVSCGNIQAIELDARWQLDLAAAEALAALGVARPDLTAKHRDDPRALVRRRARTVESMVEDIRHQKLGAPGPTP